MAPNTPSAIASGLLARSTCPVTTDVTWKAWVVPRGSKRMISRSTAGTFWLPCSSRSP